MSIVEEEKEPILVLTKIGGFIFDAVLDLRHQSTLTITEHPVETGATISDHAFINPRQLTIQIGMSDVAHDIIGDKFSQGNSRSITAYQELKNLQISRMPFQVITRLDTYDNMLIKRMDTADDYTTRWGLKVVIELIEIYIAIVQTVKVSARPHVTDDTVRGPVQVTTPPNSFLDKLKSWAQGLLK